MPAVPAATLDEGKTRFNNRHFDDAITIFRELLRRDPANADAHHYLGRSLLEKRQQDEATREFCEAIRKNPSDGNSRYWLATILLEKGNPPDALALIDEAMRLEPGLLHRFAGPILAGLQKHCPFATIEEFFKNSISLLEAAPFDRAADPGILLSRASLHGCLGDLYFSKGLLNGAMLQYQEAVRLSPKESSFHGKLADIYFITNNGEEAVAGYRAALVQDPGNAELRKRLGDALVKTRQFIDAFNEYREASRLEPENEYYRKVFSQFRTLFIDDNGSGTSAHAASRPQPRLMIPSIEDETFQALVRGGENEFVEFKSSALWSRSLSKAEIAASESREVHKFGRDASRVIIAKTIAGFLNTEGGNLIIGIREDKSGARNEITGIEKEYPKLKDPCTDGYRRMLIDEIIKRFLPPAIFHHLGRFLRIHFIESEGHTLCWLEIKKADDSVFVKVQDEEAFFIRIDAETRQLSDKALLDYCRKRFP